jgi:hypothetical protein
MGPGLTANAFVHSVTFFSIYKNNSNALGFLSFPKIMLNHFTIIVQKEFTSKSLLLLFLLFPVGIPFSFFDFTAAGLFSWRLFSH